MSEYDSILKEKKNYKEIEQVSEHKKKPFPWLKMDLFAILVVLCVSYIVYYRTVLAPDKMFLWDISQFFTEYQDIIQYMQFDDLMNDSYRLGGDFSLGEEQYHYDIIHKNNVIKADFGNRDNYLLYYSNSSNDYIKLSGMGEEYIQIESNNIFNLFQNIKNNFSEVVSGNKYIKRFYMDGTTPVVEANLTLKNIDIQNILKLNSWQENIEVLFTIKNHAFTNEVISIKVVVNDLNRNERKVITYEKGEITYFDGDKLNLKFVLQKNQEDFTLKIYRSEILYSVLSGIKKEDTYQYMYQVIDEFYNIILNVKEENNNMVYQLESNIESDEETIQDNVTITMAKEENVVLDDFDLGTVLVYSNFTEDEKNKYEIALENVVGNLREFIKKYQSSINEVNDENSVS